MKNKTFEAAKKRATIQYRKNGNQFIEYWLLDKDDNIKIVSPAGFKRTPVVDTTADSTFKTMCNLKLSATQFNKRFDIVQDLRGKGLYPITKETAKQALEVICK